MSRFIWIGVVSPFTASAPPFLSRPCAGPPHGLVEELQEYVQAGYIYIPSRENQHKAWGEQSGCRRELAERNAGIVDAYRQGVSLEELGDKYCLSRGNPCP